MTKLIDAGEVVDSAATDTARMKKLFIQVRVKQFVFARLDDYFSYVMFSMNCCGKCEINICLVLCRMFRSRFVVTVSLALC